MLYFERKNHSVDSPKIQKSVSFSIRHARHVSLSDILLRVDACEQARCREVTRSQDLRDSLLHLRLQCVRVFGHLDVLHERLAVLRQTLRHAATVAVAPPCQADAAMAEKRLRDVRTEIEYTLREIDRARSRYRSKYLQHSADEQRAFSRVDSNGSERGTCVICLQHLAHVIFLPCRHMVCCDDCTNAIFARTHTGEKETTAIAENDANGVAVRCPVCRDVVWLAVAAKTT